jgi:uncharacterized membrane protein YfcA
MVGMSLIGLLLSVMIGVSLGFFGGGGSILTVPVLVYVFGLDPKPAIASSLLVVAFASVVGALHHWRVGNVRLRTGLVFGTAGMLGAHVGGRAGSHVDGGVLLLLFAAMMLLTASAMWRGRQVVPSAAGGYAPARLMLQGLAVGSFTGLVGAGGGFLIVPALVLWAGLSAPQAVGTSLFVIVLQTLAGFSGYVSHVPVDYALVAAVSGCAIVGSVAGSRLARRVDPATLRRAFAGFVLAMACLILVRQGGLVLTTGRAALPTTWSQVVFAITMLGIGLFAGRASRGLTGRSIAEATFEGGEGI